MEDYLTGQGVEIRTEETCEELLVEKGRVTGVRTNSGLEIPASFVILAPGRQGAGWLAGEAARLGLETRVNPVDIGVRVELPAEVMGELTSVLYEGKFVFYSRFFEDRVRTFCMCPHGEVVMENDGGLIMVNGHSHAHKKAANTKLALLVRKNVTDSFIGPIK